MSEIEKPKSRSRRKPAAPKPAIQQELPVEEPVQASATPPEPVAEAVAEVQTTAEPKLFDSIVLEDVISNSPELPVEKPAQASVITPEPVAEAVDEIQAEHQVPAEPILSHSTALEPAIAKLEKDSDEEVVERVEHLNKNLGWVLISAGVVGMVVPGVLGTPFLLMGAYALWPGNRSRVEKWRQGHSPKVFHGAMKQINRFLDDLEKRYPSKPPKQ